jgi:hypothetical protein
MSEIRNAFADYFEGEEPKPEPSLTRLLRSNAVMHLLG